MKFNELEGANNLISEIEEMYPYWDKYRDLAEAIKVRNETNRSIIINLRKRIDKLMNKFYPRHKLKDEPYHQYIAIVDNKKISIFAPCISEAIRLIEETKNGEITIIKKDAHKNTCECKGTISFPDKYCPQCRENYRT
jgi:hypothetical protein